MGSPGKPPLNVWRYVLQPADGGTNVTESFQLKESNVGLRRLLGPVGLVTRTGEPERHADDAGTGQSRGRVTGTDDAARFLRDVGAVPPRGSGRQQRDALAAAPARRPIPEPGRYWSRRVGRHRRRRGVPVAADTTRPSITPMAPDADRRGGERAVVDDGVDAPRRRRATRPPRPASPGEWTAAAPVRPRCRRWRSGSTRSNRSRARTGWPADGASRRRPTASCSIELAHRVRRRRSETRRGTRGPIIDRRIAAGPDRDLGGRRTGRVRVVDRSGRGRRADRSRCTPRPAARGRGYASAPGRRAVRGPSSRRGASGASSTPTSTTRPSNAIYRALGYRAVEEVLRYRFER